MEKKLVKRDYYEMIKEIVSDRTDLVEFIDHELELLDKKRNSSKKPTANQVANEELQNVILETLVANDRPMSITDIQNANSNLTELSNQKISSMLTKLVNAEKVERIKDKKSTFFKAI